MLSIEKPVASPTRSLELISQRCHVPRSEVMRLYEDELADLGAGARIIRFLPIFAMRKVEETLHRRRVADWAARNEASAALIREVDPTTRQRRAVPLTFSAMHLAVKDGTETNPAERTS